MSKVTRKEWYERVNAAWPEQLPELTALEAIRAARRLYRFAMGQTFPAQNVRITSGRRYTWIRRGIMSVNPAGRGTGGRSGWESLVHDLSHYFDNRLSPDTKPHASAHARMEIRCIKEVIKRGWLSGSLKDKPKAERAAPDAKAVKYGRILAAMERWERKQKRAENALKKLRRQAKYYERAEQKQAASSATVH